jgi:hypothetical protein
MKPVLRQIAVIFWQKRPMMIIPAAELVSRVFWRYLVFLNIYVIFTDLILE